MFLLFLYVITRFIDLSQSLYLPLHFRPPLVQKKTCSLQKETLQNLMNYQHSVKISLPLKKILVFSLTTNLYINFCHCLNENDIIIYLLQFVSRNIITRFAEIVEDVVSLEIFCSQRFPLNLIYLNICFIFVTFPVDHVYFGFLPCSPTRLSFF